MTLPLMPDFTLKTGIDTDNELIMCLFNNVLVFETKCGPKHHRILSVYEAGAVNKIFFFWCFVVWGFFFLPHFFLRISYILKMCCCTKHYKF